MSVEAGSLSFWRLRPGVRADAGLVYDALQAGEDPPELEDLDTRSLTAAFRKQYPTAEREGDVLAIDLDDEQAGLEVAVGRKHVHVAFFGDAFHQMDRVVKAMRALGLACFDADERKLYPPDEPAPRFEVTPEDSAPLDTMFDAMGKQAEKARASTADPQERLKMLKEFIDSGALQREVDKPASEGAPAEPRPKKKQ
jgi:hypothetical protein